MQSLPVRGGGGDLWCETYVVTILRLPLLQRRNFPFSTRGSRASSSCCSSCNGKLKRNLVQPPRGRVKSMTWFLEKTTCSIIKNTVPYDEFPQSIVPDNPQSICRCHQHKQRPKGLQEFLGTLLPSTAVSVLSSKKTHTSRKPEQRIFGRGLWHLIFLHAWRTRKGCNEG